MLKFLIVEDETLIAYQLKKSLTRAGYEVCGTVGVGEQAVELARKERPDVILMDIRLLGAMDGIETARQIRTFLSAALIFTTGYMAPELKARASALQPIAYLSKPVDVQEIRASLGLE
jgi:CheY-like chemotaxis protein